jgi:hypothetical protein
MTRRPDKNITDEQARELWQRAAELQAAAERGNERGLELPAEPTGLSLDQVAIAAEGAGIDPDYVRVARSEQQLPDADRIDRNLWSARWLRAILREPDAIELSRLVNAAPQHVLNALRTIAAKPAFDLNLEATLGDDPLTDAVLIYRVGTGSFKDEMDWTDARVFLFTIRASDNATRLRVRVPLYRRGINLGLTGATGMVGTWAGASLGAGASAALPAALATSVAMAMVPVAIGGLAGLALGVGLYRGLYRVVHRSGVSGVDKLLQAIGTEAEINARSGVPSIGK